MITIRQELKEKLGENYDTLFKEYKEKHPRARRAFYALKRTKKIKNSGNYYTGLRIYMGVHGHYVGEITRINTNGSTIEIVK